MGTTYNATEALLDANISAERGARLSFVDPYRSITYAALADETRRMANLLAALDIRREARIALVLLDTIDFPIAFLGAIRAGVLPVPLNTLLTTEQYAYMLADSRAELLIVSQALYPAVAGILGSLPDLKHVLISDRAGDNPQRDFAEALAAQPKEFATVPTHPDETAFWLYSSGSTGAPKGTRHVQTSLMETARAFGQGILGIREDDVCLSAAKLFFAYGLGNALSFPMSVGATAILNPERPTPQKMFALMAEHGCTIYSGVPTLYAAMLGDATLAEAKGSPRLRLCVSAGEALPEHVGRAWAKRFGVDIIDGVGSTEMLHIYLSNAPGDVAYGTSGRAVPGYHLRLVDEAGQEVAEGEIGEMLVSGTTAADGYWNQREKSRRTFMGEWTRSGDKFTRDAAGRYTYCGRSDDMFKVAGNWVSPFEVESALIAHPAVLEAAVVQGEDADGLTKPRAFIVLKQGIAPDGLDTELKEHVKARIGAWKYPRWIEFVEALPKTATGKIQRFKLRG